MMTNGWQEVPLKEVAKPISRPVLVEAGTEYRTIGVKWWGMGAYEREPIDGSRTAAKTLSTVHEGDLIINKIWVRHGSVAIAGKDVDGCTGSGEFPTFELDVNRIDPRWIHWQTKMKSFWGKCDDLSRGTSGKNRIKPELFLTINIPLPPLTEQRRIVAHIESLAARVNEAQRLREEAEKETDALIGAISKEYFATDNSINVSKLGDISTRITKGESPNWQGFSYQDNGVIFVRSENVLWGELDLSSPTYIPVEFHNKLSRSKLNAGDVLINLVGASIGRTCVVSSTIGDANVNQAVGVISPNPEILDSNYLMRFLLNPLAQDVIHGGKVETARPNISLGDLRELLVPVPPLDEQRRIVAYLDGLQAKVNALRGLQSASGEELSALMPSILDKAFRGEL